MHFSMIHIVITANLYCIDTVDALEGPAQEITDFLDMVYPKGDSAQGK